VVGAGLCRRRSM